MNKTTENIHAIIIDGIKRFFTSCNMSKAVLGLSGGIDSALVAALVTEALGKENVVGILMPSPFSTLHSINDAVNLAKNLEINYKIISIDKIYTKFMKELDPIFEDNHTWDVTQENLQARIRGTILMAYSNRHKALVTNTSNKSELSMGYGTLYGDLAGSLMVIADIYKTEVYDLARYINRDREIIPQSTLTKAPSAELRDGQKDTDSLPDYDVLDPILYKLNELGQSKEELLAEGIDEALIDKILRIKNSAAFKGHQMAQLIKVSSAPLLEQSKWI